jgi:hypothetical protein
VFSGEYAIVLSHCQLLMCEFIEDSALYERESSVHRFECSV